ncbi:MAG: class I SAM-dependent methyltransferase [Sideroxydans sp.]|nr:class I SAM-dependent methyltransferase [Sideroxydans sp.]
MTNSDKPVLIFPSGMPRSLEYLQDCLRDKRAVIGASSLPNDVSKGQYPAWTFLPLVTQPEFNDALKHAVAEFNIGGIYSPNPVVWEYLNQHLKDIAPGIALINDAPVGSELSGYRSATAHARDMIDNPLCLASSTAAQPSLSELELASLFRHADLIPGMCGHEKISALCEIARYSPQGDIVEIGSWWGKSAFVLARLARCFRIGSLLCVDPWTNELLVSKDADAMVSKAFAAVDAGEALKVFEMNLLPYSAGHVNYLRMPSTAGAQQYKSSRGVRTEAFGTTDYLGKIAILHIDGNHSYPDVKADIAAWSGFVRDGGWIILDDYNWAYGNGPQRAADEYLSESRHRIETAFFMGGALFIQLSECSARA